MNERFTVVYDACVLYSAPLRDLLVRLAGTGLFRAKWTDKIHEEWMDALLKTRPHIKRDALERTRALMDKAVPDCLIEGYESLAETLSLPDPDDRHVLAAAIKAGAQTIVTINLTDFPTAALAGWNMQAQHPDDFAIHLLGLDAAAVYNVVREQRASLKNPTMTAEQIIDVLERQGMTQLAAHLRTAIDLL
jgi:hypothetical protein